jgi:hypothetical protein
MTRLMTQKMRDPVIVQDPVVDEDARCGSSCRPCCRELAVVELLKAPHSLVDRRGSSLFRLEAES